MKNVLLRSATLRMAIHSSGKDSVALGSLALSEQYTVGIELDKALQNPGSDYDMVLREGDQLIIPEYLSTVRINGEVMYPNTVLYKKGAKLDIILIRQVVMEPEPRRVRLICVYEWVQYQG